MAGVKEESKKVIPVPVDTKVLLMKIFFYQSSFDEDFLLRYVLMHVLMSAQ